MKNNVPSLRAKKGWTQEELGRRLDVSRQTIIAIENEKWDPSLILAFKIAREFGKQIEDVFQCQVLRTA